MKPRPHTEPTWTITLINICTGDTTRGCFDKRFLCPQQLNPLASQAAVAAAAAMGSIAGSQVFGNALSNLQGATGQLVTNAQGQVCTWGWDYKLKMHSEWSIIPTANEILQFPWLRICKIRCWTIYRVRMCSSRQNICIVFLIFAHRFLVGKCCVQVVISHASSHRAVY